MSFQFRLLIFFGVVAFAPALWGKTASLVVSSDLDCRLSIDGKAQGVLKSGAARRVSVASGEHRVEAVDVATGAHWDGSVTAGDTLAIPLRAEVTKEGLKKGYWSDAATGLTWTATDNGSSIIYTRAESYCRSLSVAGHSDWALPSIEDLRKLFGGTADAGGFHLTAPLKLTGWEWSSSAGAQEGEEWALDFGDGGRSSVVMGDSGFNRALCVRRGK